ncbi:type II toxin-antitoxin system HicB family antitoxin [Gluconacetobacter sp. Hr-1-5]|uniref:type II toxin-antitoxin system HicB family antitoxin n=1 Tax=Gluconacetobacter sp. Hr-1-5 TaxID=3395370 RepID=UPI003B52E29B
MTSYIALIRKDPGTDFGADFPDFPGCISAGLTMEKACAMAAEALAGHIVSMKEDGDTIPDPASLDIVMADRGNADATPVLIRAP